MLFFLKVPRNFTDTKSKTPSLLQLDYTGLETVEHVITT